MNNYKYPNACIYLVINDNKDYFIGHGLYGIDIIERFTESRYRHYNRQKNKIHSRKAPKLMSVLNEDHHFIHLINIPVNNTKELIPGKKVFRKYIKQQHIIDKYYDMFFPNYEELNDPQGYSS